MQRLKFKNQVLDSENSSGVLKSLKIVLELENSSRNARALYYEFNNLKNAEVLDLKFI